LNFENDGLGREQQGETKTTLFSLAMIVCGLPCTASILLLLHLLFARQAGAPAGGDALALMMPSLLAYALALVSCAAGALHFRGLMYQRRRHPKVWHWLALSYSLGQLTFIALYIGLF
jgi:hypothetical protein